MVKKKSTTQYQRDIAKLKKTKADILKQKKELTAKGKTMQEIKQLEREVAFLKGVGSKRRMAKDVGMRLGKQAGSFGWKGLKIAGNIVKKRLEAEAREQARDRELDRKRGRNLPKTKSKAKVKQRPRARSKVKTSAKPKSRPKTRVRAKVKNGRRK